MKNRAYPAWADGMVGTGHAAFGEVDDLAGYRFRRLVSFIFDPLDRDLVAILPRFRGLLSKEALAPAAAWLPGAIADENDR